MVKSRGATLRIYNPGIELLLLCTANQCRSPMAEGLLRRRLERAGIDASVTSAGVLAGGVPPSPPAVEVLEGVDIDITGAVSRSMTHDDLAGAHLIVGMERRHVVEAAALDAAALDRAFTLKELVAIGERTGSRRPDEAVTAWLERVGDGRNQRQLLGVSFDDSLDVADPIGQPADAYRRTATELDGLLARLVALVWPAAPDVGPLLVAEHAS